MEFSRLVANQLPSAMKLLHKTTRDSLLASVSILVVTGVALFAILRNEVGDEMNEQLELQAEELFAGVSSGKFINTPFVKIAPVQANVPEGKVFGDSMIYDRVQKATEEYHYLRETKNIGGQRYQVVVMTGHIGWDRYYLAILYVFVAVALLLTGSGVLINYLSNKNIWTPFFDNLKTVRRFSVSSSSELILTESSIDEFRELNLAFRDLTERSRREYHALREFTENASHEIQTPLSIIQSKLDRMSQMVVDEQMANYIVQAKSGVDRLSKMNKSLLLLAKLDHKVFTDRRHVSIRDLLDAQLTNMDELFINKKITVQKNLHAVTAYSDPYLADILLTNLLSNTLLHTPQKGTVAIDLKNNALNVSNTGPKMDFDHHRIFERFTKSPSSVTSTGLGLSIVKEICLLNQWNVSYRYLDGKHHFEVVFEKEKK
jgi:signal transduction histidine kinase